MSLPHLVQHLQSIPILRAQHQHLLFAHPDILPVLNRNFLLCWNRNFSFCCDNYKFLRRIPVDPMTGTKDWGLRSMQDEPDSASWGGQNVFDIFTRSTGKALDGTNYTDW